MLKIDCITLAKNNFDVVELGHLEGKAVITLGSGSGAPTAEGRFHMSNGGMRTMCTIEAALASTEGTGSAMKPKAIVLDKPSDLTVELTADVVREFEVQENESVINLKCEELTAPATPVDPEEDPDPATGTQVFLGDTPLTVDVEAGTVELPAPAAKDRVVTLRITNLKVGTAVAKAPNAGHKIAITPDNPEGLLHFMILCNTPDVDGRKANKTTFEVRGAKPWKVMGERQCVAFLTPHEKNAPEA